MSPTGTSAGVDDIGDRTIVDRAVVALLSEHPPSSVPPAEFLGARYDAGLAWVHFDRGFGGLGLSPEFQPVVTEALEAASAPRPTTNFVGVHQGAAAVHAFASDELKRRWLRAAFTNEEFWCQLFSEPGAGSDLAGLSTSALRDGDTWVINGQKVWTSFAHVARWGILLARTDPSVPKHRGLTFFVVDMRADGVDVRPLRTIDGARHFNEVFLSDVRVPDRYRLGAVGEGWAVAMHLLGAEREGIGDNESALPWLLEVWGRRRVLRDADRVCRDRVTAAYITNEVSRLLALRSKMLRHRGGDGLAPVVKLVHNQADQETANLVMDLLGADGTLGGNYEWQERGDMPSDQLRFLWTREATIGGGTAQVMRNLIAERLLGLPGDIRVDKDVPWNEVPRS